TASGDINFQAGTSITMKDLTTLTASKSGQSTITLNAVNDIAISQINSENSISITSTLGKLSDNTISEDANLTTTNLVVVAATGIGSTSNDLDTQVAILTATNTSSAGIYIDEKDSLTITSINASHNLLVKATQITQSGNISSVSGSVHLKSSSSITMATNAQTTVNDKTISYEANGNIGLATLNAGSGHVDLRTSHIGEILDVHNDGNTNVTASTMNMIGHGAFGRGAETSDASIAALKNKAIETNVNKVYMANSNTEDANVDVLIGKDTLATLIEKDAYSLQFVNKGLFLNSDTQIASNNMIEIGASDSVSEYKFTKQIDYQLLDYLAKKSDQLTIKYYQVDLRLALP
ncbi:hypothetical protein MJH12_16600, partial [bacterium]|nr:hypothetical protein [bacterium]